MNRVKISADVQDVGSGSESIPVKIKGNINQIAFNVRYLLEGLKAINSEYIIFQCNSNLICTKRNGKKKLH